MDRLLEATARAEQDHAGACNLATAEGQFTEILVERQQDAPFGQRQGEVVAIVSVVGVGVVVTRLVAQEEVIVLGQGRDPAARL